MAKLFFEISESDLEYFHSCIACSARDSTKISDVGLVDGIKFLSTSFCNSCGHVYRSKLPSENWFLKNFKKRNHFQLESGWDPINPLIEEERFKRYLAIGTLIKNKFGSGKSILDMGCGPGTGLEALKELGYKIKGVDADESRSSLAKEKGFSIFEGNWRDFQEETKFDIISSIHSLEHFHDPAGFLQKMRSLSHKDTLLYIEVPEVMDHVKDWNDSLYLAHPSNFNENSLVRLAGRNGWELLEKVKPYTQTHLPKENLCMIFKASFKDFHSFDLAKGIRDDFKSDILKVYKKGLPSQEVSFPLHFVVREINDLSLTFKRDTEVKKTIYENYENREVASIKDSCYLVS